MLPAVSEPHVAVVGPAISAATFAAVAIPRRYPPIRLAAVSEALGHA